MAESDNARNRWICTGEKTLLSSPFMKIIEQECHSSEDAARTYRFYLFRSRDWCNVIPVTEDGKIVMVRQYRIGTGEHTLEIPGGVVDAEDSDVQAGALRELAEETGYEPLPGASVRKLGWVHPNPAIQDNRAHAFIVGPVRKTRAQKLDPGEMIEVVEVPISDIPARVASGEISHSIILNAFFFLALESPGGRDAVTSGLEGFQASGVGGRART